MSESFLKSRFQSIKYALEGARDILKTEHNAWVHAFFTTLAFFLSFWLKISRIEFVMVVVVIAIVWLAESFNTVFELVIDIVSPEYTHSAKRAKDIAAAAVLFGALGALIVGLVIFGPPLLIKCKNFLSLMA